MVQRVFACCVVFAWLPWRALRSGLALYPVADGIHLSGIDRASARSLRSVNAKGARSPC